MKNFIKGLMLLIAFFTPIAIQAHESEKKTAILMVHFGSTYDETRSKTIEAIDKRVAESFPDVTVATAFTSRIIIKKLKERGIEIPTPQEALLRLAADGYETVIIQGSYILDGLENQVLLQDADLMRPFFKEIRVGKPLLYSIEDCEKVVDIISEKYQNLIKDKEGLVLVGHGSLTPANATYSQIDYMFSAKGYSNVNVATIEGYPTFENLLAKLKVNKNKRVTLIPFMFVAGDHANNDIANDWREELEKNGYKVSVMMEGLGEVPQIQDLYIEHIKDALHMDFTDLKSHKQKFIKENL